MLAVQRIYLRRFFQLQTKRLELLSSDGVLRNQKGERNGIHHRLINSADPKYRETFRTTPQVKNSWIHRTVIYCIVTCYTHPQPQQQWWRPGPTACTGEGPVLINPKNLRALTLLWVTLQCLIAIVALAIALSVNSPNDVVDWLLASPRCQR